MAVSVAVFAQQLHIAHCLDGCPVFSDGNVAARNGGEQIVVRHLFAASISETGLANWLAYRVLPATVGVASLLPRYWQLDKLAANADRLVEEVGESNRLVEIDLSDAQDSDYRVNEVALVASDRGRLAPMTSFADTPYWSELNYLSNMTPMPTDLRTGAWARLDQAINELAQQGNSYHVISGPIYGEAHEVQDTSNQPTAFFKIIATDSRVAAFVFPSDALPQSRFCDYVKPLAGLSEDSGIVFFPRASANRSEDLASTLNCQK